MAVKLFFVLVTVLAYLEFSRASPTRRQLISITESTVSESPVTSDGTVWDDNDEFDLDGGEQDQDDWFSRVAASPSAPPDKAAEYAEYDDDYSRKNTAVDFGDDDDDGEEQDAEEEEEDSSRDSKFLFLQPKDTRLMLDDDDDDQSGPIKVRHTGRNSYPRVFDGTDNSVESSEDEEEEEEEDEDDKNNEHPYDFTIDEDDKDNEDDEEDDGEETQKEEDDTAEALDQHDDDEDDEDFVSEGEDGDMFENPEEDAAQVIYGDHVFLY